MQSLNSTSVKIRKSQKERRGRFCRSFIFTKELLRHTFFKTDFESEKKSLEEKLITKAWLCHCLLTTTRVIGAATKSSYWQKAYSAE